MADWITSAIREFGRPVFECIATQIKYLLCFGRTETKLEKQVQDLVSTKGSVAPQVDAAKVAGESILPHVDQWLNNDVKDAEDKVKRITERAQDLRCCPMGCSWFFWSGYKLGKEATNMIREVKELESTGKSILSRDKISFPAPPPGLDCWLPTTAGFQIFASTKDGMDKALEALKKGDNFIIGMYGMGGVGKTTLVKEIGKRAESEKLFAKVVMATVSHSPDVEKIQTEIAEGLGLKLEDKSAGAKAAKISDRLKRLDNNVLIILDDLWGRLELADVGIPSKGDCEGCKVLITSRNRQVCAMMECGDDDIIEVKLLSPEDSWNLFKSKAGEVVEVPGLKKLAEDVAKECQGLPVALAILGLAMRGQRDVNEWNETLKALRSCKYARIEGMENGVFSSIRRSIDRLPEEDRLCFLFCCLFPEDYQIDPEVLTMYAKGEGFLEDVSSLKDAEGRVLSILNKLKSCCLLLEGTRKGSVMLHDVVRDVAIRIASEGGTYGFHVEAGKGLTIWPERMKENECLRLSLMDNPIDALPEQSGCTRLRTLILGWSRRLQQIPHEFFQEMASLRVLDLHQVPITSLPTSFACLTNLKTLRLGTSSLKDISVIGELKQLEILSLRSATNLKMLPEKISNLTRLMHLDLSGCSSMKVPPNILSRLSRLERLYMAPGGFDDWQVEGSDDTSAAGFAELGCLPNLTHLSVQVRNTECLSQDFQNPHPWDNLEEFHIGTAESEFLWWEFKAWNSLAITKPIANWVKPLLSRKVREVELVEWSGLKSLIPDGLGGDNIPTAVVANLEVLTIRRMPHLESIISRPLPLSDRSLHMLTSLTIYGCDALTAVLSTADIASWPHALQRLDVQNCRKVKEVFHYDHGHRKPGGGDGGNLAALLPPRPLLLLPQLERVRLINLPELTSIWEGEVPQLGSHDIIINRNLETLRIGSLNSLRYIVSPALAAARAFEQLQELRIFDCEHLQKLTNPGAYYEMDEVELGEVGHPSSSMITDRVPFANLRILRVWSCPSITSLFSWREAVQGLPQLEQLHVTRCSAMKEIIQGSDDDNEEITDTRQPNVIVMLPRLRMLALFSLPALSRCHGGRSTMPPISFPYVRTITVRSCGMLDLPFRPECFPNLEEIRGSEEWFEALTLDSNIKSWLQGIFKREQHYLSFFASAL